MQRGSNDTQSGLPAHGCKPGLCHGDRSIRAEYEAEKSLRGLHLQVGCDPAAYESRSRVSMPLHRSMHLCDCDGLMSCKAGA